MNLFSLLEESSSSFLRASSSATIGGLGWSPKPEPHTEQSTPFNASENHRESNAFPSRGTLRIKLHPVVALPFPTAAPLFLHSFTGLPDLRDNLSPFKGPFE